MSGEQRYFKPKENKKEDKYKGLSFKQKWQLRKAEKLKLKIKKQEDLLVKLKQEENKMGKLKLVDGKLVNVESEQVKVTPAAVPVQNVAETPAQERTFDAPKLEPQSNPFEEVEEQPRYEPQYNRQANPQYEQPQEPEMCEIHIDLVDNKRVVVPVPVDNVDAVIQDLAGHILNKSVVRLDNTFINSDKIISFIVVQ